MCMVADTICPVCSSFTDVWFQFRRSYEYMSYCYGFVFRLLSMSSEKPHSHLNTVCSLVSQQAAYNHTAVIKQRWRCVGRLQPAPL